MNNIIIAPSIIAADFSCLGEEIKKVEAAGADAIHVDIMDGQFVPTITIGELFVKMLCKQANIPLDLHFMVSNPEEIIPRFFEYQPNSITFHYEGTKNCNQLISDIKTHNINAGISITPATNPEKIKEYMSDVYNVLIMSVEPGFSGQAFMPEMLKKVKDTIELRQKTNSSFSVWMDGGINLKTIEEVSSTAVQYIVMGSGIFKNEDYAEVIRKTREYFSE